MMEYKDSQEEEEEIVSTRSLLELPRDILMEIVSRLPVSVICPMRCVCKTLCSIISHPSFSRLFLVRPLPTNLVILSNNHPHLFLTEFYKYCSEPVPNLMPPEMPESFSLGNEYKPLASCKGFILLTTCQMFEPITYCVSNPIIGQYMKLPFPKDIKASRHFRGFGFCPSTNEFKVIQICCRSSQASVVEVHTLGTYTWREAAQDTAVPEQLDHGMNLSCTCMSGTCLNGALHWMVVDEGGVFIHCFDLKNERFSLIPSPDVQEFGDDGVRDNEIFFGDSGGHLYISNYHDGRLDMWILDDYGVKNSWTKVLSKSIFTPIIMLQNQGVEQIEVRDYASSADLVILCCHGNNFRTLLLAYRLKATEEDEGIVGVEMITSECPTIAYIPNFISLSDVVSGDTYQLKFGHMSSKKYRSADEDSQKYQASISDYLSCQR